MQRSAPPGVLLDQTQDKVVLLDEAGRFRYANNAVRHILGFEPEELCGESAFDYVHPEDVQQVRTAFERTITADSFAETTVQYRHRTSDGDWVWLESRMSNVTDEDLEGYVVSSRDITDRIEAEQRHQELTDRLEEIAATADDVLWMFNGSWTELLFVNPAYEETYGTSVEELKDDPQKFLEAIHPDDRPAVRAGMARLSAGQPVDIEYRVNPERDYNRWVWVQAQPIVENDEVVRITGFTRDISDRRRRERQLYVMDNLLRHNLRNDLNIISGAAELIEERVPEVADQTAVIRRTSESLLDSAEKERKVITLLTEDTSREEFDLVAAVQSSVDTALEASPEATIDLSLPPKAIVVAVRELSLALTELIENSIRHSGDDDPTLRLSVDVGGDVVTVVLEDPGPPIPAIEADVLRGKHDMTSVYHSSGLGLWLVYWTVELSDGDVAVRRSDAGGNRIVLGVPRASK